MLKASKSRQSPVQEKRLTPEKEKRL